MRIAAFVYSVTLARRLGGGLEILQNINSVTHIYHLFKKLGTECQSSCSNSLIVIIINSLKKFIRIKVYVLHKRWRWTHIGTKFKRVLNNLVVHCIRNEIVNSKLHFCHLKRQNTNICPWWRVLWLHSSHLMCSTWRNLKTSKL